ncbi:MAG: N-(5'-phosphoribosyl)anthranilate isomerase [Burkholderiales bacterium PBB5]|nr:MAG: N-(5'-phosphoribosyl)anthranilate isomerase [Burkholderiales bacterium PBB5]
MKAAAATTRPHVKVCCISSHAEADLALAAGAHALGLVSAMPSGPGVIDEALIAAIAAQVAQRRPDVQTFLLTSQTTAAAIVAQHQRCRTTTLQLVDHVPHGEHAAAAVKELGGTGRTHDWAVSRRIRAAVAALGKPLYLAGGLNSANVAEAVAAVQPFGLDVCSGVRLGGQLDAGRLAAFFAALSPAG